MFGLSDLDVSLTIRSVLRVVMSVRQHGPCPAVCRVVSQERSKKGTLPKLYSFTGTEVAITRKRNPGYRTYSYTTQRKEHNSNTLKARNPNHHPHPRCLPQHSSLAQHEPVLALHEAVEHSSSRCPHPHPSPHPPARFQTLPSWPSW